MRHAQIDKVESESIVLTAIASLIFFAETALRMCESNLPTLSTLCYSLPFLTSKRKVRQPKAMMGKGSAPVPVGGGKTPDSCPGKNLQAVATDPLLTMTEDVHGRSRLTKLL